MALARCYDPLVVSQPKNISELGAPSNGRYYVHSSASSYTAL